MGTKQLVVYPSKMYRVLLVVFALLFLLPAILTGNLWPFGANSSIGLTAFTALLMAWAIHLNTMRVVFTGEAIGLYYLLGMHRGTVRIDTLKRVEQFTDSIINSPITFIRLEDESGSVVRFVSDSFSRKDIARLAAAIQQAVAASPEGARKDFVVLRYLQGTYRLR